MKAATLATLQPAAVDGARQWCYFASPGFSGWSTRREMMLCHPILPHCGRLIFDALDFDANVSIYRANEATTTRPDAMPFLDQIAWESTPGLITGEGFGYAPI